MKIKELEVKIQELKTISEPTEEQKKELSGLEQELATETQAKSRFEELSGKDEKLLTSEEVDEYLKLLEKFTPEPEPSSQKKPEPEKKYAGRYDTVEALIEGYKSSEDERKRIEEDENAIKAIEDSYKDSQRKVTKLVADRKPIVRREISTIPLEAREFNEMTREEYDEWEKKDKLSAQAWLSNATRKESSVQESRIKVLRKYPNWMAEINGVIDPSKELIEWDRLDKERTDLKNNPNWPELVMDEMEKNLGIKKVETKPKVIPIKPGFEQGKTGGGKPSGKKRLTAQEYEALSQAEKDAYWEEQSAAMAV